MAVRRTDGLSSRVAFIGDHGAPKVFSRVRQIRFCYKGYILVHTFRFQGTSSNWLLPDLPSVWSKVLKGDPANLLIATRSEGDN